MSKCKYDPPIRHCNFYYHSKEECLLDVCEDDYVPSKKIDAVEKYTLEALKNITINSRKKNHKCEGCPWGTWTGLNYKCALPRCMPKLGSNGVDKNGQTKKNS